MRLNEYQKLAMRTSPDGHDRVKNGCMGLIGESGELMDVLKKHMFQSGENPQPVHRRVIDECGDVMWYLAELSTGLEIDMQDILQSEAWDCYTHDLSEREMPTDHLVYCIAWASCAVFSNIYTLLNYSNLENEDDEPTIASDTKVLMHNILCLLGHIAKRHGATLDDVMAGNIKKLQARYPEGFDPEKSLHRDEAPPWEEA